ncbi:MAG TPA: HEAT repeat domain-containing protein [Thermoanaerobaculia bacterium]|nr:HEAT repeat domain-containing protein [Thermoanaerobaculia bacterium]
MPPIAGDSQVSDFIRALSLGWKNLAQYPPGHPTLVRSLEQVHERIAELSGPSSELVFGVASDGLIYGDNKIESTHAQRFANALYTRGVAIVQFESPAPRDIEAFLRMLSAGASEETKPIWEQITAAGITCIHLQPVDYSAVQVTDNLASHAEAPASRPVESRSLWDAILRALLAGKQITSDGDDLMTGVQSVDQLSELIVRQIEGSGAHRVEGSGDSAAAAEAPQDSRAARPSERPEAATRRMAEAVGAYLGSSTGLKKQLAGQQAAQLLRSLPKQISAVVLREVMRTVATDESAGSLLRDLAAAVPRDEIVHALRYVSSVSKLSASAVALLQAFPAVEEPGAAPPPGSENLIAEMVAFFGQDDADRFNPTEHREFLESVTLHIPPVFAADEGDMQRLGDRIDSISDEAVDRQVARTILDLLPELGPVSDPNPILERLEAVFRGYLTREQIEEAVVCMERLQEILITTESAELRKALEKSLERLASEETIQTLIDSLVTTPPEKIGPVQRLIEALGSAATRTLLMAMAEETKRSRRRRLFDFVCSLGTLIVPEVIRFLSDSRWYVVRNMIVVLRTVNDRTSLPEIRRCAQHPDLRVRLEAIKTLLALEPTVPSALLEQAINDPDPKAAEAAIALVGSYGIKEGIEPLLRIITKYDFLGTRRPLRVRALLALGELADPDTLPRLAQFFKDPFLPWPAKEERRVAFETLASYPEEARAPIIEKGLRSRDAGVREICGRLSATSEES